MHHDQTVSLPTSSVALPLSLRRLLAARTLWAFLLPFTLYLATLAPTVYNLDSAELTTAAATGGLTRATGYPLYLLLGRLWSHLPVGDVGYRMNLFSALCGALTVALMERVLWRLRVGTWATLGALGLLTLSRFFWALSLIAEVYTLHTLLMAAILLLLLRWGDNPTAGRLAAVALLCGLGLGHHAATVLLFPAILWYLLVKAPRAVLTPRSILAGTVAGVAGLAIYLYLPLLYTAQPIFNYAGRYDAVGHFHPVDLTTPAGLWWLISGKAFSGSMLAYHGAELWAEVQEYALHLWRAFFAVGIGPGLIGIGLLLRRDWRLGGMVALMFVASAAFYIDYRVVDKETMFLPTYLIWVIWLGVGLQWLLEWVAADGPRNTWLMRGSIAGFVVLAFLVTLPRVNLSNDWSAHDRGVAILSAIEPNGIVFGWWETIPVVEYLKYVEGARPDVTAINRFNIAHQDMLTLIFRESQRRPVYMDDPPDTLLRFFRFEQSGPIVRLWPRSPDNRGRHQPALAR